MLLLLDIGNTRLKWTWHQPGALLQAAGFLVHEADPQSARSVWSQMQRPQRVLAASVAGGDFNAQLASIVEELWGLPVEWVRSGEGVKGMETAYPEPRKLGIDRWAASVGAYLARRRAVCVVDCGSAITFDAVTAAGRHLGGLIVPGLRLMRLALHQGTAELPFVEMAAVQPIASDTATAINSGILLGAAAMVEGLAQRVVAGMDTEVELWLTGGDAVFLQPHLSAAFNYAPDLVLQGLAFIANPA